MYHFNNFLPIVDIVTHYKLFILSLGIKRFGCNAFVKSSGRKSIYNDPLLWWKVAILFFSLCEFLLFVKDLLCLAELIQSRNQFECQLISELDVLFFFKLFFFFNFIFLRLTPITFYTLHLLLMFFIYWGASAFVLAPITCLNGYSADMPAEVWYFKFAYIVV